jgi:GTP-binding protein Era
MNQEAAESLHDADLVVWLVDVSAPISAEDKLIADRLNAIRKRPPVLMTLSKCDLVSEDVLLERKRACLDLFPANDMVAISSITKEGLEELKGKILASLPLGEHYYDADTVTDYFERDIAGELIREAVLEYVRDEVPHCIAVQVDQYEERGDEGAYIVATILVERDSQKGIIIGQHADMIKKIGMRARQEIESMSGRKVYLDLNVKVNKNWRNSSDALILLGFTRGKDK